jgi:hypothetical protein
MTATSVIDDTRIGHDDGSVGDGSWPLRPWMTLGSVVATDTPVVDDSSVSHR